MPDEFLMLERQLVDIAILSFLTLSPENANNPTVADKLFEAFGPGNIRSIVDRPFERFHDYELLLKKFQEADGDKYKALHKGTPFYFLAWTAFDMGNHEKALFYMDAAISEDIRKNPDGWLNESAPRFLLLEGPGSQPADRIARDFKARVETQLERFNGISGFPALSTEDFLERFAKTLVQDTETMENRSIVTAFYSFILEFDDLSDQLALRSKTGGSIEPFVTHLFKGGLIFESLLKHFYKDKRDPANEKEYKQIGQSFKTSGEFRGHFPEGYSRGGDLATQGYNTTASDLKDDIIDKISTNDTTTAFETTAKLRNTTGHKLTWDDHFSDHYGVLFEQEVNAILLIAQKNLTLTSGATVGGPVTTSPPPTTDLIPADGPAVVGLVGTTTTTSGTLTSTTTSPRPVDPETTRSG